MEWIKCSERLPDNKNGRVFCFICSDDAKERCMAFIRDGTDAYGNKIKYWHSFYGDELISNVNYWMEIPPPPK